MVSGVLTVKLRVFLTAHCPGISSDDVLLTKHPDSSLMSIPFFVLASFTFLSFKSIIDMAMASDILTDISMFAH